LREIKNSNYHLFPVVQASGSQMFCVLQNLSAFAWKWTKKHKQLFAKRFTCHVITAIKSQNF